MPLSKVTPTFAAWTAITPGSSGAVALQHHYPDPLYVFMGTSAPAADSKIAFVQAAGEKVSWSVLTGDSIYVRLSADRTSNEGLTVYT